jgi:hypothetical protein
MKNLLLIVAVVTTLLIGCGNPLAVTQNSQADCTSGTLLMTGLTPTSLSLVSGQTKTFNAVANVYGTHCQNTAAVIGIGTTTLISTTASFANNIVPWTITGLSLDPSVFTSNTGTITIYLTTTDNRTSPTYYIPWAIH